MNLLCEQTFLTLHSNSSKGLFCIPRVRPVQYRFPNELLPWSKLRSNAQETGPSSQLQTEDEILRLIDTEGPFDGVIGYSGGAALAAQLIIRDIRENPWKLSHERVFRWAVFINGGTPLDVFRLSDVEAKEGVIEAAESEPVKEAAAIFLRPSNVRVRQETDKQHPDYDPTQIKKDLKALQTRQLVDGRLFMTNGVMVITRYNAAIQGRLIDISTLHVRSPTVKNRHWGLELMELCEQSLVREFFHQYDHDFPRGRTENEEDCRVDP
ncbi:hypothetical protein T310_6159 [Rasamsonia emersonii CBS 393.64]|uniref:Serine hydrolase domain-containing protein n=1 Tax=Rasamsonia emersonii (strain ATCC 16479 / CBS 393.64 / IMI 116815) TaxID=1408163 RepID=A0A0F4YP21_RASE3|nr:hypothetical protein T310_6159 [Rasamsonia emersonii CBS 393.64]KKA19835.1 hypothetical protein T310_6159 [Rasamsonia emersonii CBS 393.64]